MDAALMADAREWLCTCFPEQEDEIAEASDAVIEREIARLYDGGVRGFVADFADLGL